MGTTRLLASCCRGDSLDSTLEEVAKLKGLDEITANTRMLQRTRNNTSGTKKDTHEFQIMLLSLMPTCSKLL